MRHLFQVQDMAIDVFFQGCHRQTTRSAQHVVFIAPWDSFDQGIEEILTYFVVFSESPGFLVGCEFRGVSQERMRNNNNNNNNKNKVQVSFLGVLLIHNEI